jgi:hypothetical protein
VPLNNEMQLTKRGARKAGMARRGSLVPPAAILATTVLFNHHVPRNSSASCLLDDDPTTDDVRVLGAGVTSDRTRCASEALREAQRLPGRYLVNHSIPDQDRLDRGMKHLRRKMLGKAARQAKRRATWLGPSAGKLIAALRHFV